MPPRTGLLLLAVLIASAYELDQNESYSPRRARFSHNSPYVSARLSEYHVHPLTCIRGLIIAHDELLLMH
ncbi:hypothetical protein DPX16_21981 [Anabarilius grahami]|uniref:Uncharacterized protein n=1 Tax=Anabarilius grahami TaxID=495550 RepID=A0A3N0XMP7_ANAGA|nr:hypothetical protein DPX16_21981 [Anabarilius grahami]